MGDIRGPAVSGYFGLWIIEWTHCSPKKLWALRFFPPYKNPTLLLSSLYLSQTRSIVPSPSQLFSEERSLSQVSLSLCPSLYPKISSIFESVFRWIERLVLCSEFCSKDSFLFLWSDLRSERNVFPWSHGSGEFKFWIFIFIHSWALARDLIAFSIFSREFLFFLVLEFSSNLLQFGTEKNRLLFFIFLLIVMFEYIFASWNRRVTWTKYNWNDLFGFLNNCIATAWTPLNPLIQRNWLIIVVSESHGSSDLPFLIGLFDLLSQILHAGKTNKNAYKALIAAEYTGVQVELAPNFEMGVSNKTPEFLKMNPIGKVYFYVVVFMAVHTWYLVF